MELLKGVRSVGLLVYLEKEKTLVIGDVHIGYEDALNRQGVLIPRFQFREMMQELKAAFEKVSPKEVVLLGDLKHDFGTISRQEWKDTIAFLDFLTERAKVTLLKGNHDKILAPIANKRGLEVKDYYSVKDFFLCHGDRTFDKNPGFKKAKTIIIGHEHPAVGIREGLRLEKYKCFLIGRYKGKSLLVAPSINPLVEGTDLLQEKLLSPFIKGIDNFNVIIVSDKAYDFGKIKNLRKLNQKN